MTPDHHHSISRETFLKAQMAGVAALGLAPGLLRGAMGQAGTENREAGYRVLGRSGLKVGPIGFGASRTMETVLVRRTLDLGINFLDTGRTYLNGQNEVMVGRVIKGRRDEVVIQSKIKQQLREQGSDKQITATMEASLAASPKLLRYALPTRTATSSRPPLPWPASCSTWMAPPPGPASTSWPTLWSRRACSRT